MRVMTGIDQDARDEMLRDEGLAWVNRLLSGAMTGEDAAALRSWRAASPAHERAFVDAVRLRRLVRGVILETRRSAASPRSADHRAKRAADGRRTRRALLAGGLAASGAGYLAVNPPGRLWPSLSELTSDYRTEPGERRAVALGDGVSIELNTRTSAARDGAGMRLVSGEVAVTSRRAAATPFVVTAGAGRVLVADGAVNVRLDGTSACVTCLAGTAHVLRDRDQVRLESGRQVLYTAERMGPAAESDLTVAAAWRKGLLIFRDAPLEQVVGELNRYRAGRIILVNEALARRPVYGVFQTRRIGHAVEQIQSLTGARASHLPGGVVVLT